MCGLPCYHPISQVSQSCRTWGLRLLKYSQQGLIGMEHEECHPLVLKVIFVQCCQESQNLFYQPCHNHTALLSTKGLLSWKSLYKHLYTQLYLLWGLICGALTRIPIKFPIRMPNYSRLPMPLRT